MGYFSNGTEGMDYQYRYCNHCMNDIKGDCPVWLLHLVYNYDQNKDAEIGKILDLLIPISKDKIGNDQCRMFIPRSETDLPLVGQDENKLLERWNKGLRKHVDDAPLLG